MARDDARERAGGRAVLFVLAALVLLAGGAYVAAYLVASEKVPRGTTVAGVAIGGQSEADAARTLEAALAERTGAPLQVTVGSVERRLTPDQLGLGVDVEASVSEAGGGRSWRPQRLWDFFTGGSELPPVLTVDDARLDQRLQALGQRAGTPPVDGAVAFTGGGVQVTPAQTGAEVDAEQARALLLDAVLVDPAEEPASAPGGRQVELPLRAVAPDIDQDDVDQALATFANPAVSAPVTLVLGEVPLRLQPRDYEAALAMRAEGGALVPDVDGDVLTGLVDQATVGADAAPVDATVALVDGRPKVVKARPGVSYDPAAVLDAFTQVVALPDGQRQTTVPATVAEPSFTTKDARALGIKEVVSEFTTSFPYAEYRNTNIGRAAEIIDGTVLKPGETFSLNDTVGERTRENGFTEGFVISNGIFKEDLGGGVSQMATTLFNAMFFAGLEDVEHKPHSFYIDRYPVGREATVAWGAIDLRFRNDTDHGVLIDTSLSPSTPSSSGSVSVRMWSTKTWDVETTTSDRYNLTQPDTRTLSTEDCYPNTGYGGFDVDVTRTLKDPGTGAVASTETFTTTYTPSDTVICRPPGSGRG